MKITPLKILLIYTMLSITTKSHAENLYKSELKKSCATIKQYRELGQKFYDQKQYKEALAQFKNQASWSAFCFSNAEESGAKISEKDIEIANNNVGLSYAKLNKPLWARAWFQIDKQSKISQFNLKQLHEPKQATDLSGEYVNYAGFGEWDYISISKKNGQYLIAYSGVYMGITSLIYGPNMGEFETTMPLNKKQAMYQYEDCKISLQFKSSNDKGNFIEVNQSESDSGCGFGHNVYAGGTYMKVES